ncbi:MAG: DUF3616 domain-containing protein [Gammaproteobacteria bacterium]|nr:DUF3616 domain-containing protein [Gammaproteobacteria bacterium]MCP5136269.1 DUF3616 domain-containing protein [Gammaproteobacteria bacterium]
MNDSPIFRPLPGLFEPSAVQQLPDGRFFAVEDEKDAPFSTFRIAADGTAISAPLAPGFPVLNDLEGLAADQAGRLYAITSHSRDSKGEAHPDREQLIRFRIEGAQVLEPRSATDFKAALLDAHPIFAEAVAERDVKGRGGLNVEALEIEPATGALMIGLRSPVLDGRAIIVSVTNPDAVFDRGEPMQIAPDLISLDLGGDGLRGMAFVPDWNGYLLISGPAAKSRVPFKLWFWQGSAGQVPQRVQTDGMADFAHAEGICPARIAGQSKIVIVSDDGSRKSGRFAQFAIIDLQNLKPSD